jgi:hypothetical protein
MHQHSKQIYLQIVQSIEQNESNPNGVESSEVIVANTGHRDKTEFT